MTFNQVVRGSNPRCLILKNKREAFKIRAFRCFCYDKNWLETAKRKEDLITFLDRLNMICKVRYDIKGNLHERYHIMSSKTSASGHSVAEGVSGSGDYCGDWGNAQDCKGAGCAVWAGQDKTWADCYKCKREQLFLTAPMGDCLWFFSKNSLAVSSIFTLLTFSIKIPPNDL